MPNWLGSYLAAQPLAALFAIIALGVAVGRPGFRGISAGDSGVLFVALGFGALGVVIPEGIAELGVVLFIYAVGLQAGPRFFRSFRGRALGYATLAGVTLGSAFLAALGLQRAFDLDAALTVGLLAGALTSTPGLAAGLEVIADPSVSVGYGIAYPFGAIGVILFVQVVPRLLGVNLKTLGEEIDEAARPPRIKTAWLRVANPQLERKRVGDLAELHMAETTISRVARDGSARAATHDTTLELGDFVRVVGRPAELDKMITLIGPEVEEYSDAGSTVTARDLVVTSASIAGRALAELGIPERYGVVVARVWRDELEFVAGPATRLEVGDTIRVVGAEEDCNRLIALVGHEVKRLQWTQFLPLSLGLLAGTVLGTVPFGLPGGGVLRLGSAGGPLFVALVLGHFGRIGRLPFRIPIAAKYFIQQLGLFFFLAGAGVSAGGLLVGVLADRGLSLAAVAIVLTVVPMAAAYLVARFLLKLDLLTSLGAICGGMTSTPGLGAVVAASGSEAPTLAYASVYPVALIVVIILVKALCAILLAG